MAYSTRSARGRRHETIDSLHRAWDAPPAPDPARLETLAADYHQADGDWYLDYVEGLIWIIIPGSGPEPFAIRGRSVNPHTGASWHVSGSDDAPTLTPSLHCVGRWHGHMHGGELISV